MKGTQVTDITSTNALVIEKGLDLQGQSSAAQADVAQFYDSVQTTSMLMWAVQNGLNMAIAYVLLILHLLPQVNIS
eukprot:2351706-Karenia_brevis.AAC.1